MHIPKHLESELTGELGSPLLMVELFARGLDNNREGVEIVEALIRNELDLLTGHCGTSAPMKEGPYLQGLRLAADLAGKSGDLSAYLAAVRRVLVEL
jgi:hypothetical protein